MLQFSLTSFLCLHNNGMWRVFIFSFLCSFFRKPKRRISFFSYLLLSCISSSFRKCQKEHQIWGKSEGKGKTANLLFFYFDSQTMWLKLLVTIELLQTVVFYVCKLTTSNTNKHKWLLACHFAQQLTNADLMNCVDLLFIFLATSLSQTPWQCQVDWSHPTKKKTCTICWSLSSWINSFDVLWAHSFAPWRLSFHLPSASPSNLQKG